MPRLADTVEALLRRATEDARRRRHAAVGAEHLLRAAAMEEAGRSLLRALGVDVLALVNDLEAYLSEHAPRRRPWQFGLWSDRVLRRTLARALAHAQASEQEVVHLGGLLAALYDPALLAPGEQAPWAVQLLCLHGVSRLALLHYIAHGIRPGTLPLPVALGPGPQRVVLHNDAYTTMEFVVAIAERVLGHSTEEAYELMLQVHRQGRAVAGIYPAMEAQDRARRILHLAMEAGYPLLCTLEPA
ncbi:MAG: ATP-dependent Clp protease adaptor ClpS [Myxococcales bacterium]|nr:ATP-dependent Clp protease adaptor ClpS [Myxococcota bacterium]MDW8280747.1 ATP-dependent Clp protease adaptor ClpS [Myxococcales bacterium]